MFPYKLGALHVDVRGLLGRIDRNGHVSFFATQTGNLLPSAVLVGPVVYLISERGNILRVTGTGCTSLMEQLSDSCAEQILQSAKLKASTCHPCRWKGLLWGPRMRSVLFLSEIWKPHRSGQGRAFMMRIPSLALESGACTEENRPVVNGIWPENVSPGQQVVVHGVWQTADATAFCHFAFENSLFGSLQTEGSFLATGGIRCVVPRPAATPPQDIGSRVAVRVLVQPKSSSTDSPLCWSGAPTGTAAPGEAASAYVHVRSSLRERGTVETS